MCLWDLKLISRICLNYSHLINGGKVIKFNSELTNAYGLGSHLAPGGKELVLKPTAIPTMNYSHSENPVSNLHICERSALSLRLLPSPEFLFHCVTNIWFWILCKKYLLNRKTYMHSILRSNSANYYSLLHLCLPPWTWVPTEGLIPE